MKKKLLKYKKKSIGSLCECPFKRKKNIKYRAKLESVSLVEKSPRENYSL